MNSAVAKLIRRVIPSGATDQPVNRFLQKIRRRSFRRFYESTEVHFSQAGQDRFLNETIFKGKRNGTFIEIGAAEGITFSNTYFFEKELGWSGVCVEPLPEAFAKLTAARTCRCIQACITDFSGSAEFLAVDGVPTLSGLISKYDPRHVERIKREVTEVGGQTRELQVACYTFDKLMEETGMKHVDYLSIDTEGGELDLLRTINLGRYSIDVVSVENNFADGRLEVTMNKNSYDLVAVIGDDDVYLRREVDGSLR